MHPEDLDFETRAPRCPRYQELRPDNHGNPDLLYQKIHNIKEPDLRPDTSRGQDIFIKNTRSIKTSKYEDSDPSRNQELRPHQLETKISQPDRPEALELRNLKIQTPQDIRNFDQIYQTSVPIHQNSDQIHGADRKPGLPDPQTLNRETRYTKMDMEPRHQTPRHWTETRHIKIDLEPRHQISRHWTDRQDTPRRIWNPDTRSPDIEQTDKTHQE
ncbi:hypothetical protein BKA70DRAFT_1405691 [Coprinopsis sp. MPI-PUGE-AT-0042]|nr:hypothetical protein BKA70DRAFT_1405691 [Coprinopsis sp. MPI-PUGE-AT-0042]